MSLDKHITNRHFRICSNWSVFNSQLTFLREIFLKNGDPENFIDRCFKFFLKIIHILKEKVPKVKKKPLRLAFFYFPYLRTISLQTRTKLHKSIEEILKCCKLQIFLKSQNKLCNNFRFKHLIPQILTSGVIYKFQCGLCDEFCYRKCVRHLTVRNGEHVGISLLTNKRLQPRKDSDVCHHLLNCNYSITHYLF